jgi:aromatic-L-amino-acid/L-tryptophan decarboxylase
MPAADRPLEPDRLEMEVIGRDALDYVIGFLEARPTAPVVDVDDDAWTLASRLIDEPPQEAGDGFSKLLATIDAGVAKAFDTTGPGYMAYVPGGGVYSAAVAELIAAVTNRYVSIAEPAPALAAMEASVLRWSCRLFGLGERSAGILTSGGSMANFSAMVAARADRLGERFLDGTLYVSDHAHQSIAKAAMLAGLPADAVRTVPCTEGLTIEAASLIDAIRSDRAAGRRPFLVVANAGTTNTGAIDPIAAIADIAADEQLWLHVDAAYGGFFQLTRRGRAALGGIERADSITLDPHKGLFLPYGVGSLLVRDHDLLRRAHQVEADYLQDLSHHPDIPSFADYSPELSRDFRGLRMWLPLHLHGVAAFRAALDEKLDLASVLHQGLARDERIELPWTPALSIVAFRLRGADDKSNLDWLARINGSGRIFLSSTRVDGRTILRACILCHRTHRDRVDEAVEIIRDAIDPTS